MATCLTADEPLFAKKVTSFKSWSSSLCRCDSDIRHSIRLVVGQRGEVSQRNFECFVLAAFAVGKHCF